jgi:hypothetical protein
MQKHEDNNLIVMQGCYLLRTGYLLHPSMVRDGGKDNPILARTTDKDLAEILELHESLTA